ncbi:hypothetical protein QD47_14125 [Paenibacillus terrae]|uniref:Uncharacterized protein n=1 Tax=Paenibacillus terrae TaxID=159743 RepID=A0A0D7X4N4_9BACL|nr:hypothetical protein QD47_14125 [Paenibacillus terrae]
MFVVLLREDLFNWQKLNVTVFLMSSEPYVDGDGVYQANKRTWCKNVLIKYGILYSTGAC